jgi:hypothetical protein
MIITLIVVVFAVLSLVAFSLSAIGRRRWAGKSTPKAPDVRACRVIMDRDDEMFLRERLPASGWKALKRQKIAVSLKYVNSIARYVAATQVAKQPDCESPDPASAHVAMQMMDLAAEIHRQCMVFRAKLTLEYMFPSLQLSPVLLVPLYQAFRESVNRLNALHAQRPASVPA